MRFNQKEFKKKSQLQLVWNRVKSLNKKKIRGWFYRTTGYVLFCFFLNKFQPKKKDKQNGRGKERRDEWQSWQKKREVVSLYIKAATLLVPCFCLSSRESSSVCLLSLQTLSDRIGVIGRLVYLHVDAHREKDSEEKYSVCFKFSWMMLSLRCRDSGTCYYSQVNLHVENR
jgi:hypothetical protein